MMTGSWYRIGLLLLLVASCDTIQPQETGVLVVEAFLRAGAPLPSIRVDRTVAFGADPSASAVSGAVVELTLDSDLFVYVEREPGWYEPDAALAGVVVQVGVFFDVQVRVGHDEVTATGRVPPPIRLDRVDVRVPPEPVEAVLLDSLLSPIDSLQFELPTRRGYIYAVEVTMWWADVTDAVSTSGDVHWVETRLDPVSPFSSTLVDFFLLPRAVIEESKVSIDTGPFRVWSGVYAVPVETAVDPVPAHDLRVAVVRGSSDFARFALSRDAPESREPVGNVTGGLGIVAGVAVDSVRIHVP